MSMGKNTVSGDMLRGFVERVERIDAEKKELSDARAAVMAEAKAAGFQPKALAEIVRRRRMKPHDLAEAEAVMETYLHALGMGEMPPLWPMPVRLMGLMNVDAASREQLIEHFKKFAPVNGDIILRLGGTPVRLFRDKDGNVRAEDHVEVQPSREQRRGDSREAEPPPVKPAPDVDEGGAESLGRQAWRENKPVTDNPFPFGDPRRASFDAGWRKESGSDGMGE